MKSRREPNSIVTPSPASILPRLPGQAGTWLGHDGPVGQWEDNGRVHPDLLVPSNDRQECDGLWSEAALPPSMRVAQHQWHPEDQTAEAFNSVEKGLPPQQQGVLTEGLGACVRSCALRCRHLPPAWCRQHVRGKVVLVSHPSAPEGQTTALHLHRGGARPFLPARCSLRS